MHGNNYGRRIEDESEDEDDDKNNKDEDDEDEDSFSTHVSLSHLSWWSLRVHVNNCVRMI